MYSCGENNSSESTRPNSKLEKKIRTCPLGISTHCLPTQEHNLNQNQ